jgi:hydroxymethylbilane synthase
MLDHPESALCVRAERAFLRGLGGGCQIPIAALGEVERECLHLAGMVSDPEGKRLIREDLTGPAKEAEKLGEELARRILPSARKILHGERLGASKEEVSREG